MRSCFLSGENFVSLSVRMFSVPIFIERGSVSTWGEGGRSAFLLFPGLCCFLLSELVIIMGNSLGVAVVGLGGGGG